MYICIYIIYIRYWKDIWKIISQWFMGTLRELNRNFFQKNDLKFWSVFSKQELQSPWACLQCWLLALLGPVSSCFVLVRVRHLAAVQLFSYSLCHPPWFHVPWLPWLPLRQISSKSIHIQVSVTVGHPVHEAVNNRIQEKKREDAERSQLSRPSRPSRQKWSCLLHRFSMLQLDAFMGWY